MGTVHGSAVCKLMDMDAETFLRSPENIVKGVKLVAEKYLADGVIRYLTFKQKRKHWDAGSNGLRTILLQ